MIQRIPFDSTLWVSKTSDMEDPVPLLRRAIAGAPNTDEMYDLLDCLYETDNPSPQFFYAIPYLLDILEPNVKEMLGPIKAFCRQIHGLRHVSETDERRKQLESCEERILRMIAKSLVAMRAECGFEDIAVLLSGIANMLGHTDLGHQISELNEHG